MATGIISINTNRKSVACKCKSACKEPELIRVHSPKVLPKMWMINRLFTGKVHNHTLNLTKSTLSTYYARKTSGTFKYK